MMCLTLFTSILGLGLLVAALETCTPARYRCNDDKSPAVIEVCNHQGEWGLSAQCGQGQNCTINETDGLPHCY